MPIDLIPLLEYSTLAATLLWTFGLACVLMGSRRARRAFRGKGYLRPPTGKAWLRFIYFKHYDSFEDPMIRFYYRVARVCLFLFIFLVIALFIFVGSVGVLGRVASGPGLPSN